MNSTRIDDIHTLGQSLLQFGNPVDTGHWQSLKDVPQTKTIELMGMRYTLELPERIKDLAKLTSPNLPWAELQFQERVAGEPVNPGETYKLWPWYRGNVEEHKQPGQFSHTYMERFWPKLAGQKGRTHHNNHGIRYPYGDLNDVVHLLAREPHTRQAVLPVYFPEDTGSVHGERVPCSLHYQFLLRENKLHIFYSIRSCDYLRHFRDDVYMAGRLCQWVLSELQDLTHVGGLTFDWNAVVPGTLTMDMGSLHVFEGDLRKMRKLYAADPA